MDGKGISRVIRGYFLTEESLMAKLFATFVSATNVKVEEAEAGEVALAEDNGNGNSKKKACTLKYLRV